MALFRQYLGNLGSHDHRFPVAEHGGRQAFVSRACAFRCIGV